MKKAVKKSQGFTLVELIVVIAILIILAAILIPVIGQYIDDANQAMVIANARNVLTASKTTVIKLYAKDNASYMFSATRFGSGHRGRITNNMLGIAQKGSSVSAEQKADYLIAKAVLEALASSKTKNAQLNFRGVTYNPQGVNVNAYEKMHKCPGVIVCYTDAGEIDFIEYGDRGYICHMDSAGNYTVTENGVYANYPK